MSHENERTRGRVRKTRKYQSCLCHYYKSTAASISSKICSLPKVTLVISPETFKICKGGDIKIKQDYYKKENYKLIFLINIARKILNKMLANWIQEYIEIIRNYCHMEFIPGMHGCFRILRSMKVTILANKEGITCLSL